ncbi:MAG: MopE-related protein [Pseudomonadota bacterium]|nr:MopE-related protein [Pseudomonadota bacterium]
MRSLLPLLFLLACTPDDGADDKPVVEDTGTDTDTDTTDTAPPVDADGDGFSAPDDCDDTNARINPDASERCNEIDDDCDGRTDEFAVDQELLYPDEDRDGFGVEGQQSLACPGEAGLSASTDDCDDTDGATYPGAPEDDCADATDRNCDEIAPTADQDGDGTPGCDDCDDTNDNVYPGAPNVCDDCDDATVATPFFTSDFTVAPEGLSINGDATVDGGALQLTLNAEDSAGAALFSSTVMASVGLEITFTAEMCCDGGDDGLTLAFLNADEPETGVGSPGGSLGFLGLHGHAVALDTWLDTNERSDNAVTLLGDVEILMATGEVRDFAWDDGEPHEVRVVYSWEEGVSTVRVAAGGIDRLTASWDQADTPLRLGFTGGTSQYFHEFQSVDDVSIGQCD